MITIRKTSNNDFESPFSLSKDNVSQDGDSVDAKMEERVPAHKDFREKYFRGFRKEESSAASPQENVEVEATQSALDINLRATYKNPPK